ncbi:putative Zinc finger DHHC domain containing transmembrane protein [Trypanosoma theileri]|uniref:Palmitoyltransferase n=1 Tax=Trypanosoma theileri TaxID=67003 RepID=A0A1X0NN08_9TRYP|nr:putative Zinc finger DHHC domain containing transmembrane protein [Trypanosoma theileri]ORC85991.1 putative Zinc finger DHHC domain containing transmembrane protein [Trypanosoma theileri]
MGPTRYHRDGVVGQLYRLLMDCPGMCCGCCCGLFFGCSYARGRRKWNRCTEHTFHERNSFMVIFYILLVWSVEFLYLVFALPYLEASLLSKFISIGLVVLSEWFYLLAVCADPGVITAAEEQESQRLFFTNAAEKKRKELNSHLQQKQKSIPSGKSLLKGGKEKEEKEKNEGKRSFLLSPEAETRQNQKYILDGILYGIGNHTVMGLRNGTIGPPQDPAKAIGIMCVTCHVPRPSRSKHCRLCDRCVRRFDHHCPWINNDVAEGTHRWFLLFLVMHAMSCAWASWDLCAIMKGFLVRHRAWGWVLYLGNGRVYHLRLLDYIAILVTHQTLPACLLFFAVMIGLVLWAFWAYQMSFVLYNLTTNDMMKIDTAVDILTSLPSLEAVYREALNVQRQLEMVAARPPRSLQKKLKSPPENVEPNSKADKAYRNGVRKLLLYDLKGLFDRGMWNNLMEVMFPYS